MSPEEGRWLDYQDRAAGKGGLLLAAGLRGALQAKEQEVQQLIQVGVTVRGSDCVHVRCVGSHVVYHATVLAPHCNRWLLFYRHKAGCQWAHGDTYMRMGQGWADMHVCRACAAGMCCIPCGVSAIEV